MPSVAAFGTKKDQLAFCGRPRYQSLQPFWPRGDNCIAKRTEEDTLARWYPSVRRELVSLVTTPYIAGIPARHGLEPQELNSQPMMSIIG
jgi:hypothetical protein